MGLRTCYGNPATVQNWIPAPDGITIANHMLRPILLLAAVTGAFAAPLPSLMPMPWTVSPKPGELHIDSGFRIAANCSGIDSAIQNFSARVFRQAGLSAIHLPSPKPAL